MSKSKKRFFQKPIRLGLGFDLIPEEAEQNINFFEEKLGGEFYYDSDGSVADW